MPSFHRRQFLLAMGAAAGSVALKGCLGEPPDDKPGASKQSAPTAAAGSGIKAGEEPEVDRKSTRLNSSHRNTSRMPSSA